MKPAHTRSVVTQLPLMRQLSHTGQHVSKTVESARGDACAGEAVKMRALTTEPTDRGVVTIWPKKVLRRLTRVLAYIAYPAYGFIVRVTLTIPARSDVTTGRLPRQGNARPSPDVHLADQIEFLLPWR